MNSKQKGKRGELELAAFLREHGFEASRGQQFKGGAGSPDVICEALDDLHFEVKRTEKFRLEDAMAQATMDAPMKIPVVVHRKNRSEWVAILPLTDFLDLVRPTHV